MSNGIMERNLPVAESIGEGDKVRIVTAAGNSKNIDASEIGGGGSSQPLMVHLTTEDALLFTFDKTFGEIYDAIQAGQLPILESSYNNTYDETIQNAIIVNAVVEHQYIGQENETYMGSIIVFLYPYSFTEQVTVYYAEGNTLEALRTNYPYHNFSD